MNPADDWIDQARGLLEMLTQGGAGAAGDDRHAGDCRWCPVCQAAAVVRGERPEVTVALADVLTAAASALRSLAEADRPPVPRPGTTPGTGPVHRAEGPGEPAPVVQRIEIA